MRDDDCKLSDTELLRQIRRKREAAHLSEEPGPGDPQSGLFSTPDSPLPHYPPFGGETTPIQLRPRLTGFMFHKILIDLICNFV